MLIGLHLVQDYRHFAGRGYYSTDSGGDEKTVRVLFVPHRLRSPFLYIYIEGSEFLTVPFNHLVEGVAGQNMEVLYVRSVDGGILRVLCSAGV